MPKKDYSLNITPANAQRRPEHVQEDAWICDFLGRAQIGRIATRWDEQPFINPTTFWYDAGRHEIAERRLEEDEIDLTDLNDLAQRLERQLDVERHRDGAGEHRAEHDGDVVGAVERQQPDALTDRARAAARGLRKAGVGHGVVMAPRSPCR